VDTDSVGESLSIADGVVQIAFDLAGTKAGYLIISVPEAGSAAESEFYGHGHYVEVKEQFFGRYGGMRAISWDADARLEVSLVDEVPDVGSKLRIKPAMSIAEAIITVLRRLQSTLPNGS
jgi:hypothetical protein